MSGWKLPGVVAIALITVAGVACAADPWVGAQIMPKSDQLLVRVGRTVTGSAYHIEWPATVRQTEGQWCWIEDQGAYRVPAVAGWVSKEDVYTLAEAQGHYIDYLRTSDAPWIHWLAGICLERGQELGPARRQYLRALGIANNVPDEEMAVRAAVEMNSDLLDAAIRLERVRWIMATSADEARAAATQLQFLAGLAERRSVQHCVALLEQARAHEKAFRLTLADKRKNWMRSSKKEAGPQSSGSESTAEFQPWSDGNDFFESAEGFAHRAARNANVEMHAGPHLWRSSLFRAELRLTRIAHINAAVLTLIASGSDSPAPDPASSLDSASETVSAADATGWMIQAATMTAPIDLRMLEAFCKRCQEGKSQTTFRERARTACICLAWELKLLRDARECFDEVVEVNPDLPEAYRDRALTYLAMARCEGTLWKLETTIAGAYPDLAAELGHIYGPAGQPQDLDSTLVQTSSRFESGLAMLKDAAEQEALIATKKQDFTYAATALGSQLVAGAIRAAPPSGKRQKAEEPQVTVAAALQNIQDQLADVRDQEIKTFRALERGEENSPHKTSGKSPQMPLRQRIADAKVTTNGCLQILDGDRYLQLARNSAMAACEKTNFADAEPARVLAEIYFDQRNFDRAQYYQKLAVVFVTSENERPQLLELYRQYRAADAELTPSPKPLPSFAPPKAAAKSPADSGGDGAPANDSSD